MQNSPRGKAYVRSLRKSCSIYCYRVITFVLSLVMWSLGLGHYTCGRSDIQKIPPNRKSRRSNFFFAPSMQGPLCTHVGCYSISAPVYEKPQVHERTFVGMVIKVREARLMLWVWGTAARHKIGCWRTCYARSSHKSSVWTNSPPLISIQNLTQLTVQETKFHPNSH